MTKNQKIVLFSSIIYIALNCVAIMKEFFLLPFISVAAILLYLLIFKIDILIYLMAFVTPFSIIFKYENVNLGLSVPSEIIMISLSLLFLFRIIYDIRYDIKVLKHPVTIAVLIYLLWLLVTSITSTLPIVSFKFLLSKLWFIISGYFVVILLIKKDIKKAVSYINCYAVALAIVVIIVTIKHGLRGFPVHGMHWIMSPFYNDHTAYGAVLAFFLCFMIGFFFLPDNGKKQKIFYATISCILTVGLYLSFSRAAWLSFIGVLCIWAMVKLRIKFSWFVMFFSLLFFVFFSFSDDILYKMGKNTQDSSGNFVEHVRSIGNIKTDASNVERLNRWVAAFGMIEEKPVTGWGPGTYQFQYAPFQKGKYKTIISTNFGNLGNAHSEYIGPCAETGFVGLLTVFAMMILIIYTGLKTHIKSKDPTVKIISMAATLALISYYLHGILNNFLDTDKLSLPFWAAFSIIVTLNLLTKQQIIDQKHAEN